MRSMLCSMLLFQLWPISVHPRFVGGESLLEISHKKVAWVPCLDSSCSSWASLARFFAAWRDDWQLQFELKDCTVLCMRWDSSTVGAWRFQNSITPGLQVHCLSCNRSMEYKSAYIPSNWTSIAATVDVRSQQASVASSPCQGTWHHHPISEFSCSKLLRIWVHIGCFWKNFTSTRQAPSNNSSPLWSLLRELLQHSLCSWFLTNTKDLLLA